MTSESSICSLCFNNAEDKDLQVINTSIQDMFGTLLMNIDISASESPVMCWTCHRKLENNYCFKKKCIFTEDTLRPFVAENVKMNLNEIRNQIIKSEVEVEKNVCRLCLQYSDDDMTLNEDETQQFQGLFPEINLNLTNFVILCLTCYNTLHKYFIFVMPFLSNQIFDNTLQDIHKSSMDIEESDKKNVLLLTGEIAMKSEEDFGDFLEEKVNISVEEINDIKSEDTKSSIMDFEESDDIKPLLLHEELNIKSDEDSSEGPCLYINSSSIDTSVKLQANRLQIENRKLEEPGCHIISSGSLLEENCINEQEDSVHTDTSKNQMYKCEKCNYKTKYKKGLTSHIIFRHTDPPKVKMYKCDKCDYESKWRSGLYVHIRCNHTDLSEIKLHKCGKCDHETKYKLNLRRHILSFHTSPSETPMYKCDKCDYESKFRSGLLRHVRCNHSDLSKVKMYKCDKCEYETKLFGNLRKHIFDKHTDPFEIQLYRCEKCNYKSKYKKYLKSHITFRHADRNQVKMYKCDKCDYESKSQKNLNRHILLKHTDSSKVQMNRCDKCDYETKCKLNLRRHILSFHTSSSETPMYKCDKCDYESKFRSGLLRHVRCNHSGLSKVKMYKCDKCEYETKLLGNLRKHIFGKHTDPSEIQIYRCENAVSKTDITET